MSPGEPGESHAARLTNSTHTGRPRCGRESSQGAALRSAILSKKRIRGNRVVYTKKRIFIVVLALLVCLATAVWASGQDEAAAAGKVELDFSILTCTIMSLGMP